jgi:Histidine kinase-, DNA gyrase B-, and HSP90-like ATPase
VVSTDLIRFDGLNASTWKIQDVPHLRVMIADDGMGMDEETQARIFEPFFTTKSGKGTGLGLSVVFGLMEAHHGYIDLQSKVGEGTTFSLFFPIAPDVPVPMDKIQVIAPSQLLGKMSAPVKPAAPVEKTEPIRPLPLEADQEKLQ